MSEAQQEEAVLCATCQHSRGGHSPRGCVGQAQVAGIGHTVARCPCTGFVEPTPR